MIEVEALGREVRELAVTEPQPGINAFLTIDLEFQRSVNELLNRFLGDRGAGVAIVLDPNNGDVLSMVSYPSFDNAPFAEGISAAAFERLATDDRRPLINHAISGLYPPGSTYKLVAAAGALEEKVAIPATSIECSGHLILPSGWIFYDWLLSGHGNVNLHRAISESCNVYFYNISGGNPYTEFRGLGEERLANFGREFGFGSPTGIDLPNELAGVVPDHTWKSRNLDEPWVTGDTYQAAIGQGLVQATPLQLVNMYAAIGNGGTLYKPRLVDRIEDSQGEVLEVPAVRELGKVDVSAKNLELLRRGLLGSGKWCPRHRQPCANERRRDGGQNGHGGIFRTQRRRREPAQPRLVRRIRSSRKPPHSVRRDDQGWRRGLIGGGAGCPGSGRTLFHG